MNFMLLGLSLLAAPAETGGKRSPRVVADSQRQEGPKGPQLRFHDVRLEVAAEVGEVRKRQIAMIEELLELEVDTNRRGDLLFRKAELKHERARFYSFLRGAAEEKLGEAQDKGQEAIAAAEEKVKATNLNERRASREAIAVYDRILREIPTYERTPGRAPCAGAGVVGVGGQRRSLRDLHAHHP